MGVRYGEYMCPKCNKRHVKVSRIQRTDPWTAKCSSCGYVWEYVMEQSHKDAHLLLANDGGMTYLLGEIPKREGKPPERISTEEARIEAYLKERLVDKTNGAQA